MFVLLFSGIMCRWADNPIHCPVDCANLKRKFEKSKDPLPAVAAKRHKDLWNHDKSNVRFKLK
jgi:hypothetical protein